MLTLIRLADRPGILRGAGPADPDLARDLARAAAANPKTTWCVTVTDGDGHAEPPVDLAGAGQQPGIGQRGQGEQQPGQRVPGAGGERRRGAFAQQPEPGQRPLAVPRHRIRQHRQRAARLLSRRLLSR